MILMKTISIEQAFKYPFHFLIVSDNQGEPYSWQTKYLSDSEIYISIDESISGTIYLADKKNIYLSDNYGKQLHSNINIGI